MRLQARTWFLISLTLFFAAILFWRLGEQYRLEAPPPEAGTTNAAPAFQPAAAADTNTVLTSVPAATLPQPAIMAAPPAAAAPASPKPNFRLTNTDKTIAELSRSDHAILLRNAFIETSDARPLPIPAHLRTDGDPGSYIVQSRTVLDETFRHELRTAGAAIISYIPNNAYLVRVSAAGAQQLAAHKRTQAVFPYEPYYKLGEQLLAYAVDQKPLPEEARLKVTLFPGERDAALAEFANLNAEVLGEDRSPFGPQIILHPRADTLAALARLPSVQGIEPHVDRVLLNDRTRVRLAVSSDSTGTATNNHLGLTGADVTVNLNDSGVDALHPDFAAGRVTSPVANSLQDADGHGTHVAGIIAGNGSLSATVSNVPGSVAGANFRGMAPESKLMILPVDLTTGPAAGDVFLQETAAKANPKPDRPLISNNSWGYPNQHDYNSAAASYDAAVRDALPMVSGAQPLLLVFPAGNDGFGTETGLGGEPGGLVSPATAKNVISVGAIESARELTNFVIITNIVADPSIPGTMVTNLETNFVFQTQTDSDRQVASFSSRGNVGIGIEGQFGRFKPDVVAPGTFIISTRSLHPPWEDPEFFENHEVNTFPDQTLLPGESSIDVLLVPENASRLLIRVIPKQPAFGFPGLPIYARLDDFPDTNNFTAVATNLLVLPTNNIPLTPGFWFYRIYNPTAQNLVYDRQTIVTVTNSSAEYFGALSNLNSTVKPNYRFESGTSIAAPAVSGVLALIQDFFNRQGWTPASPALMKALLINGARSVGPIYDFQVNNAVNYQGWGVVNLANTLPFKLKDGNTDGSPLQFIEQSTDLAVATGQTHTWDLTLSTNNNQYPLRVSLVWTDPPGNPNAAIKLVNDLDLIVTNKETGEVFFGNDIPAGTDFTQPHNTNSPAAPDVVNNVENIFFNRPSGTNYSISVVARKVNVDALSEHPSGTVQDFALVISSDYTNAAGNFTLQKAVPVPDIPPPVFEIANGVPVLNQRVGANSPLLGNTNGTRSQWNFYVFTNNFNNTNTFGSTNPPALTNGPYVAFLTFLPPNVSRPRNLDSDVDLYVSRGAPIDDLNFVPGAVFSSTQRGGTELVTFTNSTDGEVFYIGVKSEDQQGGEYGILGLSSVEPFSKDEDGVKTARGIPLFAEIPDGSPSGPGGTNVNFFIFTEPFEVRRAIVTMSLTHEEFGDLFGNLSHNGQFVVLNNHNRFPDQLVDGSGTIFLPYDDSDEGDAGTSFNIPNDFYTTDGPGSLNNFMGDSGQGLWLLTMVDNALGDRGRINEVSIAIEPSPGTNDVQVTVQPGRFKYFPVDVPVDATNLTVTLYDFNPQASLELYLRRGERPTRDVYDKFARIDPPNGSLTITPDDIPPLNAGRYFIGIFNPNNVAVTVRRFVFIGRSVAAVNTQAFGSGSTVTIRDDGVTESTITVPIDRNIADVSVGVRIKHSRVSDLALHLVSPEGTRLLLTENRGRTLGTNYGQGDIDSGLTYAGFSENTNITSGVIKFASPPFSTNVTVVTNTISGFEDVPARVYTAGQKVDGWDVLSNRVTVIASPLSHSGANLLNLNNGIIRRVLPTVGGRQYTLRFAYRAAVAGTVDIQMYIDGVLTRFLTGSRTEWKILSHSFIANSSGTELRIGPLFNNPGMWLDTFQLVESGGQVYYLPEESLGLLKGQRALGLWKLEVADTRAGPATVEPPTLVSWQLQIVFGKDIRSAVTLTNGVCYNGTVAGNEIKYFRVQVPRQATIVTNQLFSVLGDLVLLLNQNGAPTGNAPPDTAEPADFGGPGEREEIILGTTGITYLNPDNSIAVSSPTPQLQPGQTYYLAVTNFNDIKTNDFTICVYFDRVDENIIVLNNKVPFTNTIAAGDKMDFYLFTVAQTAYQVTFDLQPLSGGNVDLYVRKDFPLPTSSSYHYRSTNLAPLLDQIVLTNQSLPVPLSPGNWYLGVLNTEPNPVNYVITATQLTNALNIITLTNTVPLDFTEAPNPIITNYFKFTLGDTDPGALFELSNVTANVTLLLARNALPDRSSFFLRAFAAPDLPGSGKIIIRTNDSYPTLRGDWYLAVLNNNPGNVDFTIRASILTNQVPTIITLSNAVLYTNTVPGTIFGSPPETDYYLFTVSSNAIAADFELFPFTGNVDLVLRKGLPLPSFNFFDYHGTNGGQTNEFIRLTPASGPVPLSGGPWYLGVYNDSPNAQLRGQPVSYAIRATEYTANIIPLSNRVAYVTLIAQTNRLDYYRYTVSSNAVSLRIDVFQNDGNVDFFVRYGLPVPSPTSYDYIARNSTLPPNEFLLLTTNSAPVPLQAGDWYIAVENVDTKPVHYSIVVDELLSTTTPTNPPSATNIIVPSIIVLTNNQICVIWDAIIGARYFVEGKTNIDDAAWTVVVPTFTATNTPVSRCFDLDYSYHFFQVIQVGETPPPAPTNVVINPQIVITNNQVCLVWDALIGTKYFVEGKTNIDDSTWTVIVPVFTATNTPARVCFPLDYAYHYFQVIQVGEPVVPPPTNVVINPQIVITNNQVCLVWDALIGTKYFVEGKTNIDDSTWTVIVPIFTATNTPASVCFPLDYPYHYFQVIQVGETNVPPPPPTNVVINPQIVITNNQVCLVWDALIGTKYFVEGKTNIDDSTWTVIVPIFTATNTPVSKCFDLDYAYHYFQVIQVGETNVPPPATNVVINPQIALTNNQVCLTWPTLIGTQYFVEGKTNFEDAVWTVVLPVFTATNTLTSWCVPLDYPYHYFQVIQVGGGGPPGNLAPTVSIVSPANGAVFTAPASIKIDAIASDSDGAVTTVEFFAGTNSLAVRTNAPFTFTWTNVAVGSYRLTARATDNQGGGADSSPVNLTVNSSVPGTNVLINPALTYSDTNICLSWPTSAGASYYLEAKADLGQTNWTAITPTNVATGTNMTFCFDPRTKPYQFFEVVQLAGSATPPPAPVFDLPGLIKTANAFVLKWTAPASQRFTVQYATNIPPDWKSFTNVVTSADGNFTFTDDGSQGGSLGGFRIYRLLLNAP